MKTPKSPNILFIQVDQMTAQSLRAYGNNICHAPNLDFIAEQGVVFEKAYCNFALCSPSRFSMATGQLCSTIGAYDNAAEMPATIPTYAHYLTSLGYQTALSGKMHFIGPDQHHGFEQRLTPDLYPADFSWVPNWGDEGERDTNDPRSVLISGVCERSRQIDFDEEVTHRAIRHLYEMKRGEDTRPFFLQVSYTHPHEPYLCRKQYWDLYEDVDIPMPTVPPLPEDQHDAHSLRLLKDFGMFNVKFADEDILRARRAYYGSISYIDEMVGQLITTLKETGQYDNTAIVFTSDHGDMQGERGMWFKKHFFEASARVPLLMYAPWIKPQRVSEVVSLVDLLPTFNSIATNGQWDEAFEPLEGDDLMALLDKSNPSSERTVYAEYLAEATLAPIFMLRRGAYKYISSTHDPKLLFNVDDDPHELNNLAGDPVLADMVAGFEAEIQAKWDSAALTEKIISSQKQRRFVLAAQRKSLPRPRWNHSEKPG
ncbi:MAG: choline-sulfatase, partial [Thiolinea sp.]